MRLVPIVTGWVELERHLRDDHKIAESTLNELITQEQRVLHQALHNPTTHHLGKRPDHAHG